MPRILAAASSLPPHQVSQGDLRQAASEIFADRLADLPELLRVFESSRIERRQLVRPLDWYLRPQSPAERQRVYFEDGFRLLAETAEKCLARSGFAGAEIDQVIFVTSTGLSTPTLDAYLINRLGLRPQTSRLPIWGLGCAAGAAGLSRAFDYCRAHPEAIVLLLALELCSLTFLPEDLSKKNLVASAIFADGAAAVLVGGAETSRPGPRLRATGSHLFPESYHLMGWEFVDQGMQLVLSPRLPAVVRQELPVLVDGFLRRHELSRGDLVHYLTHPGGAKVIDAYREALKLTGAELAITEEVLREHGNMSSVSVLMVLEKWLERGGPEQPGPGLLSAFGPGFSAEMLLLEV